MDNSRNVISRNLVAILLGSVFSSACFATNYFVDVNDPVANDGNSGLAGFPTKTIGAGLSKMSPLGGDTLTIEPGVYSAAGDEIRSDTLVNGTPGNFNVVKARYDGTVQIKQTINLGSSSTGVTTSSIDQIQYIRFEGLTWDFPTTKKIVGHDLQFLRCGFLQAPPGTFGNPGATSSNVTMLSVGTNDFAPPSARDILLEDVWAAGRGGRYNVELFNSENVIARRVVVRHDGGWADAKGDPEACIVIYNSKNVHVQNGICLDSDPAQYPGVFTSQEFGNWSQAFLINNNPFSIPVTDVVGARVIGSMAIKSKAVGYVVDGQVGASDVLIRDSVVFNIDQGGLGSGDRFGFSMTNGGSPNGDTGLVGHQATLDNVTFIAQTSAVGGFANGASSITLRDSVLLYNNQAINVGVPFTNLGNNYCFNNNGTATNANCTGPGDVIADAKANGLVYIVRREAGSALDTAGVGADITKRVGPAGVAATDPTVDDKTADDLWPWPYEDRIKKEFSSVLPASVGVRGWTATNQTLTEYIWGLLGTPVPASILLPAPVNVAFAP